MSEELKSHFPPATDAEPSATRSTAPIWIIVITLLLLFLGTVYFDHHSGWFSGKVYGPYSSLDELNDYQPKSGAAAVAAHGKQVYDTVCGICHGVDGLGSPGKAPPLAGSEYVNTTGVTRLIHIPQAGLNGPLQVEGKDWNLSMAPMGAPLSDADLAAVLTYIRTSWGNKASEVTPDEVKSVRAAIGARPQPLTGAELKTMPE
jgi:mono/diheme cytochrome c family protein